ncbi:DNA polymerase III subunit delta [Spiroplasma alleghenense]|uniref:DNA polymerase III subunit delta n=1 Tax=Spiroplasma alleghenense TaxID=216931 RepID=A0A345Z3I0_9MOLU|nr:DNA polymerase III subunit delta [Spiroplasma alleghenense]AXK51159.1 DNA polymerase III subunit delta [Spiroplasma alleghenense]
MYLILGNDEFLIRKELQKNIKKLSHNSEYERVNFDLINDDFNDLVNELYTFGMFSERKIIVIEEAWFLTEKKVALNKTFELEKLKKYLENPNPNNEIFFLLNNDKISKKLVISKFFESNSEIITVPSLNKESAYKLITKKLSSEGIEFDKDAIEYLLEKVPLESRIIINEINKLVNLSEKVTKKQIQNIVSKYIFYDIFEISNYFLNGNIDKFLINYKKYRSQNKDFFSFISLIISSLILMRNAIILKNKNFNNLEIAERLEVNPYRISKILEINYRNFKQINDKIKEMYGLISNIFEGNYDDQVISELFFIKTLLI